MSQRRFIDQPARLTDGIYELADDHPAMAENRTLFPSTVVTVTEKQPVRLLVSGKENRKIGATVEKGRFAGWSIFNLTLEERATCPGDCAMRAACYGNGMQLARRHRVGDLDVFLDRLGFELAEHTASREGVLVRLHVLGDFFSVEYVAFWAEALEEYENLACYGYTHHKPDSEIGTAIGALKQRFGRRFAIRWSGIPGEDNAIVAGEIDDPAAFADAVACPVQSDKSACCATCALCWESTRTISFERHGRPDRSKAASNHTDRMAEAAPDGLRGIRPVPLSGMQPVAIDAAAPALESVDPATLLVEPRYQRDLSARSVAIIRSIVEGFSWAKFKPPVCARTDDGLMVIDGQHTAIAAATHPEISSIPVLVVDAATVQERADAFVAHNRDRVNMSVYQVFHAQVVAGHEESRLILEAVTSAGGQVPRNPPSRGQYRPGDISAISFLVSLYRRRNAAGVRKVVGCAVKAGCAPVSRTILASIEAMAYEPEYAEVNLDDVASVLMMRPDFDRSAQQVAAAKNVSRDQGGKILLFQAVSAMNRRQAS